MRSRVLSHGYCLTPTAPSYARVGCDGAGYRPGRLAPGLRLRKARPFFPLSPPAGRGRGGERANASLSAEGEGQIQSHSLETHSNEFRQVEKYAVKIIVHTAVPNPKHTVAETHEFSGAPFIGSDVSRFEMGRTIDLDDDHLVPTSEVDNVVRYRTLPDKLEIVKTTVP